MDEASINDLMSSFDSPMIVVTTSAEDERAGCLDRFHSQSSISLPHYCFWLSNANHTYRVGLLSARFAIHFPTLDDVAIARDFGTVSGQETDKFSGINVTSTEDGVPLTSELPNRLVVERLATLDDGGDHVCATSRVVSAKFAGSFEALRLSHVSDLPAGHHNDERVIVP